MLNFLERIVWGFWDIARRLFALVVPFLYQARYFRGWSVGLRWGLRILLLGGLLFGLWWINWYFELETLLPDAPKLFGKDRLSLAHFWLPIIGLLVLALVWVGWWLWTLLGPEEDLVE